MDHGQSKINNTVGYICCAKYTWDTFHCIRRYYIKSFSCISRDLQSFHPFDPFEQQNMRVFYVFSNTKLED